MPLEAVAWPYGHYGQQALRPPYSSLSPPYSYLGNLSALCTRKQISYRTATLASDQATGVMRLGRARVA